MKTRELRAEEMNMVNGGIFDFLKTCSDADIDNMQKDLDKEWSKKNAKDVVAKDDGKGKFNWFVRVIR